MISCKEVFERSPQKTIIIEEVLNQEELKVFEGYSFD